MSSSGFPTPLSSHAGRGIFQDVYEAAEDSFLLMDALQKDAETLQRMRQGCSSPRCTDVNPAAAHCTARTAFCNRVALQPVITDLVQGLLPRLGGQVDVLLFNPPYVVTPSEEVGSRGIEASWAGGQRGREVTDRFLPLVPGLLSTRGLFYLVTIAENQPDDIIRLMSHFDLEGESSLTTRAGNERLSVLRFHRKQQRRQ
ncbi:methyltransferase N6AMT1-like isoform X2 [Poeciliopsis prolifica]|uniref:methyltransferase N6AMT1-like isoform X2 n=1 Tax=Poeciliopsis prolifica TaxID=188132 RepID=UPI002413F8E0|nr:methyltransferase N6AMT1-like isoform X2 [Poeciliopsis prolifica]